LVGADLPLAQWLGRVVHRVGEKHNIKGEENKTMVMIIETWGGFIFEVDVYYYGVFFMRTGAKCDRRRVLYCVCNVHLQLMYADVCIKYRSYYRHYVALYRSTRNPHTVHHC
jgi:hypothetical protein